MAKDVLFVDDDPSTTILLRRMLEKAGYAVDTARNGMEACDLLEKQRYPLVITDWEMPEMNGPELCRFIRGQFLGGYTFTILLTCRNGQENIMHGLDCGADDYLTKPVHEGELLARLQTGKRITTLEKRLRLSKEEAVRLATTDSLTSTYNRRYLMTMLTNELERSRREGTALSTILCDVDHFKRINDSYGHRMGDIVLEEVARVIKESCRSTDWVARYGGEEFVVVMPATSLSGAQLVAERIRSRLESTHIEGERYGVSVTASFGVVTDQRAWPAARLEPDRLLACADRCLYRSKQMGRNQLTCWEETDQRELTESQIDSVLSSIPETGSRIQASPTTTETPLLRTVA